MPFYRWVCEKCETAAEVLRHFNDIEVKPGEAPEDPDIPDNGACKHEWERKLGKTSWRSVWSGRKGEW